MCALDSLLFLVGHRGAIERIAATRHAWAVGAVLVLSAGAARNYDHLDLLRQPEWFIGPFAASMVSILFIFACIRGPLKLGQLVSPASQFGTFLTFAWMTAPCAWLYGIPVEGMTDIITATKWNIAFLGIVSLWRVALMTRALAVLTGVKHLRAFVLVLAPAAFEAMAGSMVKGMSLVKIMGGVRLPPHTQLLKDASDFVTVASFWIFLAAVAACWIVRGTAIRPLSREKIPFSKPALLSASVALVAWVVCALPLHPRLANRHHLEKLLGSHNYPAAVEFAMAKTRGEFPRIHHFPPEPNGWFPLELLESLPPEAPGWLREEWSRNAAESLKMRFTASAEKWRMLKQDYPEVTDDLIRHAESLKSRKTKDGDGEWWLGQFERNTKPEPEDTPDSSPTPLFLPGP